MKNIIDVTFKEDYNGIFQCNNCYKDYLIPIEVKENRVKCYCPTCGREEEHEYHIEYWGSRTLKEGKEI